MNANFPKRFVLCLVLLTFTCVLTASALYNPTAGRWLSRDPLGEDAGVDIYSFTANDPASAVDPDGRLTITLLTPATPTQCGGWSGGVWRYVMDVHSFDVYWIQKVTLEEQFHPRCSGSPVVHFRQVHYEALKFAAPPQGQQWSWTDLDEHGGHGQNTFGNHSITVEAKIIDGASYPEIEQWRTNDPRAPGMHVSRTEPSPNWWSLLAPLEKATRSSSRTWSCCCSKFEGPWNHAP